MSLASAFGKVTRFAHLTWGAQVKAGDVVVDATCGNGLDTLTLSRFVLAPSNNLGHVYAYDTHPVAIQRTQDLLKRDLLESQTRRVTLTQQSHLDIPTDVIAQVCAPTQLT
jgi:hypothetical protein